MAPCPSFLLPDRLRPLQAIQTKGLGFQMEDFTSSRLHSRFLLNFLYWLRLAEPPIEFVFFSRKDIFLELSAAMFAGESSAVPSQIEAGECVSRPGGQWPAGSG